MVPKYDADGVLEHAKKAEWPQLTDSEIRAIAYCLYAIEQAIHEGITQAVIRTPAYHKITIVTMEFMRPKINQLLHEKYPQYMIYSFEYCTKSLGGMGLIRYFTAEFGPVGLQGLVEGY